jgi:type IX secretion system PorP/SprF family membrane protein
MIKSFTLFLLAVALLVAGELHAQQDPQYSQFMFTRMVNNPGYAGSSDAICGTLVYRNQWTGFGEEPKTMLFSADMPVKPLKGGLGINVTGMDELGFEKNLYANLNYAYRMDLGSGKLGIGLAVGYVQKEIDGTKFIYNNPNDPNIPTGKVSGGTVDFGFGLYYNTDNLWVGLSSTHLNGGEIDYDKAVVKLANHYYLQAGYMYDLTPSLVLKPALAVKSDGVSTQFDINGTVVMNNKYWGGIGYRLQDAIVIMAGIEIIPNLKFGYSYDLTTSDIKTYSSGTHEIMLGYCFKPVIKPPKRQFHRNVRFL